MIFDLQISQVSAKPDDELCYNLHSDNYHVFGRN